MAAVVDPGLVRLSKDAAAFGMKPLWERVMRLKPGGPAQSAMWRWNDTRPLLLRACELITARQAERRVLMLENPALPVQGVVSAALPQELEPVLARLIAPDRANRYRDAGEALAALEGLGA